jgi:gamma-glutamyltranspeptidase/glutathione hydrolase
VVDGHNSGLGGGCFVLVRRANGEFLAIDGRETAPAAATRTMFVREGKARTDLSQTGALAAGVPGAVAAYHEAHRRAGRVSWERVVTPAAEIAERGFVLDVHNAARIKSVAADLKKFEGSRAVFFKADGSAFGAGELFRQPDLARSCRAIAKEGPEWFYRGGFARATAVWMRGNGGLLTEEDFRNCRAKLREPVRGTYRGREIVSFPPPSSGGVHVVQILNLVEGFDFSGTPDDAGRRVHLVAEAMKLAFADRAHWLGDPDFAKVPRGLVDKAYAKRLAEKISQSSVAVVSGHGTPADAEERIFEKHTTHFCAADSEGNWVACTATINTTFGSKVVVPGTGVVLNNEMDDFAIEAGVPNAFGLVGGDANAVAAGKRPLSSMSPTIVLQNGEPVMSFGGAGGPTIISQTVLNLIAMIDLGWDIGRALAQPRFHHQWRPDELRIESKTAADVRTRLRELGHKLHEVNSMGVSQGIARSADGKGFVAASDPRVPGKALGF